MKLFKRSLLCLTVLMFTSCQSKTKQNKISENTPNTIEESKEIEKLSPQDLSKYETAYFASGCFWCLEAIFQSVKGVKEVISGYAGAEEENPTYEMVGRGQTTHAEAVEVYYDPGTISFVELVQVFFGSHD